MICILFIPNSTHKTEYLILFHPKSSIFILYYPHNASSVLSGLFMDVLYPDALVISGMDFSMTAL